ncbi:hypothetical protein [Aeromicrobium sp. UC242_57]|uniref:TerC family protein n=1 Tax=Aeromicrobium sp. UC242_57 TaxID=3374624 RepID=UPI0037AA4B03
MSQTEWFITIGVTVAVLLFDIIIVARKPHEPSMKECAAYLSIYVGMAIAFGIWVTAYHNGPGKNEDYGLQFFAGWLTEYSLSIDNLFIFIIIMASFKVPRKLQQEALLVGIIIALVFRGIFIALGAVAINNFSWIFYIFGAFLLYTGYSLMKDKDHDDDGENAVVRFARKRFRVADNWYGLKPSSARTAPASSPRCCWSSSRSARPTCSSRSTRSPRSTV